MKRLGFWATSLTVLLFSSVAVASDAETSASAGSDRGQAHGTASATAHYEGDRGFARTDARSGAVNLARGVAVGFDQNGLSLSISQAVAGRYGLAVATNFNMSIGTDGRVSSSTGLAISDGLLVRAASAAGQARTTRTGSGSSSMASGRSDPLGHVAATTRASDNGPRPQPVAHGGKAPVAPPGVVRSYAR